MESLNLSELVAGSSGRGGPPSILVVRLKALGDIVLSIPVVRALRAGFPEARIRYLCRERYADALAGVTELDGVLRLPEGAAAQLSLALGLRRDRTDCVIDLLGSPRSAALARLTGAAIRIGMDTGRRNWAYHWVLPRAIEREGARARCYTLDSNEELVRMLGLPADGRRGCGVAGSRDAGRAWDERYAIGFPAAESERGWGRDRADAIAGKGRRIVGIAPGALYQAKSWREEYFIEVARRVCDTMNAAVVVLWGPGERPLAERIAAGAAGSAVAPETGIARLGGLVGALDLLVGIDSGPKHLAVIQGVPTVTLFGPTDPRVWDPMTGRHRAIHLAPDCFPCRKRECVPNRCLDGITPDAVMTEIALAMPPSSGARRDGYTGV